MILELGFWVLLAGSAATAGSPPDPAPVIFQEKWIDGTAEQEPSTQVQALDPDTFVIRQSVKTNFEAPFVYLLFGTDKALLIDSGAQDGRIRETVDQLIADWLEAHGRAGIPLVVAHSHSHGDHIAGDAAFRERQDTTVVGLEPEEVAQFFGIAPWPDDLATFDLGGRLLDIIPTPGHQRAAIMFYDPALRILLSGDTIYPGRLYVPVNFLPEERASIDRLAAFAADHPIDVVLGAHIEMTTEPGKDYGRSVVAHPSEHRLEMSSGSIAELQEGLTAALDIPNQGQVHNDFIIYPTPSRPQ